MSASSHGSTSSSNSNSSSGSSSSAAVAALVAARAALALNRAAPTVKPDLDSSAAILGSVPQINSAECFIEDGPGFDTAGKKNAAHQKKDRPVDSKTGTSTSLARRHLHMYPIISQLKTSSAASSSSPSTTSSASAAASAASAAAGGFFSSSFSAVTTMSSGAQSNNLSPAQN